MTFIRDLCRTMIPQKRRFGNIKWPPDVEDTKILGYVEDENGRAYDRDIGRSTTFNNKDYYIFGDTFCHDADGKFVGLSCNTLARIPRRHEPTECSYELVEDDGFVPEFIPFRKDENMFNEKGQRDQQRIALWCFSTIIEDSPGAKSGYIYFDKIAVKGAGEEKAYGVGISRVTVDSAGYISAQRARDGLFGPDEPRWGSMSNLEHDGYIYLFGSHEKKTYLARVKVSRYDKSALLEPTNYEYWTGQDGYSKRSIDRQPVLQDMAQGAVFKSRLMSADRPFVFVGVDWRMQSQIWMGRAPSAAGPWELARVCTAVKINPKSEFCYCVYAHPWCGREDKGELVLTWTENNPTKVVAARLVFKRADENGRDGRSWLCL